MWDYTEKDVHILTNYHTWDTKEFKYCFPPPKSGNKRKHEDTDPVVLMLRNHQKDFQYKFDLNSDVFYAYEKEADYTILKLPKDSFKMSRIPVGQEIHQTQRIHAFGYIGHTQAFNITPGEVTGFIPEGFTTNILSAPGYSGAAILADYYGNVVGYMGGNLDSSNINNSQHQSYGFRFDRILFVHPRQKTPPTSPLNDSNCKSNSNCNNNKHKQTKI